MTLVASSPRLRVDCSVDGDETHGGLREHPAVDAWILIVDDDEWAARRMRRMLERAGFYRILTVSDGTRAVPTMLECSPEVTVLDVHMPVLNGFQVLRQVRNNEHHAALVSAVLAVSGDSSTRTRRAMLTAGADDFLPRPFDSREFVLRVRRLAHVTRELRQTLGFIDWRESDRRMPRPLDA